MGWTYFLDDLPRCKALADLLLMAAKADREYSADEKAAVLRVLPRLLGVDKLPAELEAYVRSPEPRYRSMIDLCVQVRVTREAEKKELLRAVREIIRADDAVSEPEQEFFDRLVATLRVSTDLDAPT
ncbi:MAG: TerB family tellurite resistance protein [Deltaproteobacteria bacterium]|nr:TerB family tellurite resistance protein [Deltaproteobacteria bacterium]